MDFGIFLDFPIPQGGTHEQAFDDAFELVREWTMADLAASADACSSHSDLHVVPLHILV